MSGALPWIVVGGGASGLAAAFFLRRLGLHAMVVERQHTIGGRMGTIRLGDRALDCGGKNIGRRYTLFREFAASLGTHPFEHFGLNSSQAIDGRLKTLDGGSRWRGLASLIRGASGTDLARFGRLLLTVSRDDEAGYLGSPLARRLAQAYDARPAGDWFSPLFCQRILRPMTVRMNGAEPHEVHMGTLPSNVRMLLDTYEQFTNGLAPLLSAFRDHYDVRLGVTTDDLLVTHGRVTGVRVHDASGRTSELAAAGVILATPANVAAALTAPVLPTLAAQLRSVAYYPVTLALAEYERPVFSPDVRAIVFGGDEPLSNAGAYGVNDLNLVRYTFSGRAFRQCRPSALGSLGSAALIDRAEATLSRYVSLSGNRRRRFAVRRFDTGLCAYTPRHDRFLDCLDEERQRVSGLHLTGDYIKGASIEACFRAASACVQQIEQQEFHLRRAS
jgi:protoporphyrinogen/coproporphyrinogen III oxidase